MRESETSCETMGGPMNVETVEKSGTLEKWACNYAVNTSEKMGPRSCIESVACVREVGTATSDRMEDDTQKMEKIVPKNASTFPQMGRKRENGSAPSRIQKR